MQNKDLVKKYKFKKYFTFDFIKSNFIMIYVLIISLLAVILKCIYYIRVGMEGDAFFQYTRSSGPFKLFWQHNNYGDHSSFPGEYLLMYPFMKLFGSNPWGIAFPKILINFLGFFFLYKICRKYFYTFGGYFITFTLICFNSTMIAHNFELRPYSALPFLAIVCFYFSRKVILEYLELSLRMKIIIFLFFIFITIYHAYSILIIVTALLYHWLASRKYSVTNDKFHLGFIILILITTSVIWTWYALPNNLGLHKGDVQIAHNTFDFIANPASNLIEFIKDIIGNLIGCKYLLFTLIFFIALFIPSINQYQLILFFLILILLPINLILYVDIKSSYWFVQRQFIWTMPLFAFFLGWLGDILIMRFCKK